MQIKEAAEGLQEANERNRLERIERDKIRRTEEMHARAAEEIRKRTFTVHLASRPGEIFCLRVGDDALTLHKGFSSQGAVVVIFPFVELKSWRVNGPLRDGMDRLTLERVTDDGEEEEEVCLMSRSCEEIATLMSEVAAELVAQLKKNRKKKRAAGGRKGPEPEPEPEGDKEALPEGTMSYKVLRKAAVREAFELDSEHIATLEVGEVIDVHEHRRNENGQIRIRTGPIWDPPPDSESDEKVEGWASTTSRNGNKLMVPEPEPEPEPEEPRTFAVWLEGNSETAGLDAQLRIDDDGVTLTDPSGSHLIMKLPWRALSEWQTDGEAEELRILVVDGKTRKAVVVKTPRCEEIHDRMVETAQKLAVQMVHERKKKLHAVSSTPAEGVPPTRDQGDDDVEEEEYEEDNDDDEEEEDRDEQKSQRRVEFQRRVEQERERQSQT